MSESQTKTPSFIISVRFFVAILAFFGYALQYGQKIDMSVAIVCMINNTALKGHAILSNQTNNLINTTKDTDEICIRNVAQTKESDGEFLWSKTIQGLILSSYFYGYLITQIPGGWMSVKFGAKNVYLIAMFVGSVATLLTPLSARLHYSALYISRFFVGLSHGVMWPAMAGLWSHWAPPVERSRLIGFSNAGSQIGNVITLPLGAYLCVNGFDGGWPSIFYIFGIAGIVWCVLWYFMLSNSPKNNRLIGQLEKEYILETTKESVGNHDDNNKIPWGQILTSKAAIAIFVAHTCSNWGTYLFLTNIPTYMKEVLKFDIKSSGFLSAMPYVAFWLLIVLSSMIGDKLIQSKILSRNVVRKLFNALALLVPSVTIIVLSFITCKHAYLGVGLLTFGLAFTGCGYGAGMFPNINDISASYSAIVFGLSNTFATIPGFIAPYLVGVITKNQKQQEWQIVFLITAAVYFIGAIVAIVFGSASIEPWAQKEKRIDDTDAVNELTALKN